MKQENSPKKNFLKSIILKLYQLQRYGKTRGKPNLFELFRDGVSSAKLKIRKSLPPHIISLSLHEEKVD
jgi:hypothetical protein